MDGDRLDEGLRAIAHADRRLFIRLCLDGEKAAGELAARSSLSLASVSEHLKVLRKCGLLRLNKQGRFWRYRTDREVLSALSKEVARLDSE